MGNKRVKKPTIRYPYESIFDFDIKVTQLSLFDIKVSNAECYKHDYVFKKIDAGNQRELEVFPGMYASREFIKSEVAKQELDPKRMKENNTRKKYKKDERKVHANFKVGDWFMTLTFNDRHLPKTLQEAKKIFGRFIESLNGKRERRKMSKVKYYYVLEKGLRKKRLHFHVFMDNVLPIEEIIKSWGKKGNIDIKPLIYSNNEGKENFVNTMRYITKHKDNYPSLYKIEAWDYIQGSSRNLLVPKERQYKTPLPKKDVLRIAVKDEVTQLEEARRIFEKKYLDYEVTDVEVKVNPKYEGLYYIHVRMQKRSGSNKKNKRVRI